MGGIEDLLRRRTELLQEIDGEIRRSHTREVTLLFTDIVGSTRFYERMGDIAGRQMVQAHNDLLFPVITAHGGTVIKTIGDSIMATFTAPDRAVACTVAMQKLIAGHNAGCSETLRFQVRMGLHHGTAVVDEHDLFGDVVNTAARVESCAEGGEILVSGAVHAAAGAGCAAFVHLGSERVKGREEAVELFCVDWQERGEQQVVARWRTRHGASAGGAAGPAAPGATAPAASAAPAVARRVVLGPGLDLGAETAALPSLPDHGNPYLNRVMIPHPGLFVGRRLLVRRILGRLSGSRPQSLSIVGERRIGKSSLLNYLRSAPARTEALETPARCLFCFVDFQQARALAPGRLLSLLIGELRRQSGMTIEGPEDWDALRGVGEEVAAAGFRLVFLFDEFEAVTRTASVGPELYSFLRSLANTLPISFICGSGRDLKELCASREISDSPFFNIFSTIHVGAFDPADAAALVEGPSAARGVPLGPVLGPVLSMAGRLPFFLQIACSAWFEFLAAEGREAAEFSGHEIPPPVTEMFREEAQAHFEYIIDSLSPAERLLMRAAAERPSPCAEDPCALSLERRGYLDRREGCFVPFSGEFARFVRQALPS